jgi:hypothetical protein
MEILGRGCCFLNNQSTNRIKEDEKWVIHWVGPCDTLCRPPWGDVKSPRVWGFGQWHPRIATHDKNTYKGMNNIQKYNLHKNGYLLSYSWCQK